tara:strand:+ start:1492 stop:1932 length:441 start_codon:yes stop_codon:yes gene_type:complete
MGRKAQTLDNLLQNTKPKEACLIWQGCKDKDGYGLSSIKGIKMPAHRAVMSFLTDVSGQYVLHKCTNRDCINPEHLYLGDQQQNVQDQIDAGTFVYGSKNGMAKLTEELVQEIRTSPLSNMEWAVKLNLHYSTVWDARNRKWKQVK